MADPVGKEFYVLRRARPGRTDRRTRNLASSRSRSYVTQSTYRSRAAHVLGWGSGTRGVGPVSSPPQVAGESQAGHTCHSTNRLWQRGRA
jgi:hypothetical protein